MSDKAARTHRLNVTLDDEHAAKLSRLADRTNINEGTLARSLLTSAIEATDPDADNVVALLDGIDGAYERAQLGLRQASTGQTVLLDEL
jgi:predicted transcriptional regulator